MTTHKTYSVVVVLDGDKVFALRRKAKHHIGCFEFPAGKGESGEDPVHSAMREFHEETGSVVKSEDLLSEFTVTTIPDQNGQPILWKNFYYLVDRKSLNTDPKINEPETHSECGWFTLDELRKKSLVGMTEMVLPILKSVIESMKK